ncbi:matrixin family metalloprotease [Bradyrhizobium frederickii]|uniref:Matrixin family metalloprotease n=1 Tax=Bradyrhizobium frederickii TaxID=2560054 RepID=A0A4Y9KU15_9BRAD|nr:FG-GAP-like repeat-containing protein [Bradyrhizobium frederickii]TFV34871.1 matrixin family metalloprotease [Bradyrhizobium frederickii]
MATAVNVSATNNAEIDGLLSGYKWTGTITYSFPDASSDYPNPYYGDGEPTTSGFASAPTQIQAAINYAIGLILGYTNANIQYAGTNGADIMIAQSPAANPTAYAYYPFNYAPGGDIWFGTQYNFSLAMLGNYYFTTALHELGHALGLKHSQEAGGPANVAVPSAHDSSEYTVMSYRSYVGASTTGGYTNEAYGYSQTYMANDILALQTMYGVDYTTQSSNTVYTWNSTTGQQFINGVGQLAPGGGVGGSANRIYETVWDGGGVDTYDLSNYTTNLSINLNPGASSVFSFVQLAYLGDGHYASGNVYNAYLYNGDARSYIDNAIGGSGTDTIIGNAIANTLNGGGGNDTITGGAGNDTITGGAGTDTAVYSGNKASYAIAYDSTTQIFTIVDQRSGSPDGIDTIAGVENFQFGDGTVAGTTLMNNLQPAGAGWVATIAQDFNNDGNDDILWLQPATGAGEIVYLSNGTVISSASFATPGQGWVVIGHGDYNHDGNTDLLWQNTTTLRATEYFLVNGHTVSTQDVGVMSADWHVISSADLNGDGTDDLLWQNQTTGVGLEWFMNNGLAPSYAYVGTMGTNWKVASTNDLNHDGTADLLWQETTTNEGVEWFFTNGLATSWARVGTMGPGWDVAATADFNHDGRVDLLWQNETSGRLVEWFVNDEGLAFDWKDLGTADHNWKVAGLLDLDAVTGPMILMQNAATGVTTEISSTAAGSANSLASSSASPSKVQLPSASAQSSSGDATAGEYIVQRSLTNSFLESDFQLQENDLKHTADLHDFMLL